MKTIKRQAYTGNEVLRGVLSEGLHREITQQELTAALDILTNIITKEMQENKQEEETRLNKLMELKMFKYMFSTDNDLRMKTKDEVLSVYSATPEIVDTMKANILKSLIDILNVDKYEIKTQELANGINMHVR